VQFSVNLVLYLLVIESALNSVSWRVASSKDSYLSLIYGSPQNRGSFALGKSAHDIAPKAAAVTMNPILNVIQ